MHVLSARRELAATSKQARRERCACDGMDDIIRMGAYTAEATKADGGWRPRKTDSSSPPKYVPSHNHHRQNMYLYDRPPSSASQHMHVLSARRELAATSK